MTVYRAPLNEMRYWMRALGGFDVLPTDLYSPSFAESLLQAAAKFSEEVLAPLNALGDRQGARFDQGEVRLPKAIVAAYNQFRLAGWCGLRAPEQWGGQALPRLLSTPIAETWHSSNLAFALCPLLSQSAIETLALRASPEIQARFIPKLVSGEWSGTMELTEPQAGTDLSQIRCRAIREGDHYRVTGQKIYITYGEHDLTNNIVHLVLARVSDAPSGVHGLSLFAVPKFLADGERNTLSCLSIEHKLGIHLSPSCVMQYDGAIAYLIGEPHQGIEGMFVMMNAARFSVGLQGVGVAERAYQAALHYAKNRLQGRPMGDHPLGTPIFEHPDVRRMLMRMRALIAAGRALQIYTAIHMDALEYQGSKEADSRVGLLTPLIKAWNTEMAEEVTSIALQVHGGMGYIEETGVAQYLRDARITTIYEGTTGIQCNDLLGRKILKDQGACLRALLLECRAMVAQDSRAAVLLEVIDAFEQSLNLILERAKTPQSLAGLFVHAVPLMRALGRVLAGALMLKALNHAGDDPLRDDHAVVTTFFIDHVLLESLAFFRSVKAGADSALAIPRDRF